MPFDQINLLAVLVSGIVFMILGMAYYGIFSKQWLALVGKSQADLKKGNMGVTYLAAFINALVINFFLAAFIVGLGMSGAAGGAMVGLYAWIGFVLTTHLSGVLWAKNSFQLYAFDNVFNLIAFLVGGIILGVWM